MASQVTTYTPTPLAGIEIDTDYFLSNTGSEIVYIEIGTATPVGTDDALPLYPHTPASDVHFNRTAAQSVYVWSPRAYSRVYYDKGLNR